MQLILTLIIAVCTTTTLPSQSHDAEIEVAAATVLQAGPLQTDRLLELLNWDSLMSECTARRFSDSNYCKATIEQSADSMLLYYEATIHQDRSIYVTSYQGRVLEYAMFSSIRTERSLSFKYFDKRLYSDYMHQKFATLDSSLHLEPGRYDSDVLESYYQLLGAGRSEYGWFCEYSTAGFPPLQRRAVITLMTSGNVNLIRWALLHGPNIEGRIYAADALIYLDYRAQQAIKSITYEHHRESVQHLLMQPRDKATIDSLRSSAEEITTCGNAGSYRMYQTPIREVLSDEAVAEIPERYDKLRRHGFLNDDHLWFYP